MYAGALNIRLLVAFICAAFLCADPRIARADGTADEAELHFRLGKEQYKKGNFEVALTHFFQSNRLVHNRNVIFNIAGAYEALKRYPDAHRYYVDALVGETDAGRRSDTEAALARVAPFIAILDVKTDPPGATLYLQRKDLGSVGTSPRPLAIESGTYRVIAELAGYEPVQSEDVTVSLGKRTSVALELRKIVGTARIQVTGAQRADVFVDGREGTPDCVAPCELSLVPGRHDIRLSAEGFEEAVQDISISAKDTTLVSRRMQALTGTIVVRTDQRGATVKVDGVDVGFTPLVIRDVVVGKRRLVIESRGYKPFVTTVYVVHHTAAELTQVQLTKIEETVALREVTGASRITENVDDAPASVSLLDRREILAFGYPTIYEAIRGVRGVALGTDRAFATAQVRGIGLPGDYGNRFLVLSDGHPLTEDTAYSSVIAHEARVDLLDVDRIEVIRGPGSLLYGTGAMSGVVNLEMQKADAPDNVHANVGVYNDNVLHGRAGFHHNFGPKRSIWASVSAARSDGFEMTLPINDGSKPTISGVDQFYSFGTTGRVTFGSFTGQWFYHERNTNVPVGAYGSVVGDPRTQVIERRFSTEVRYEPRLSESVQLLSRAHVNLYDSPIALQFSDARYDERYTGIWFGAEARALWTPKKWLRFTFGGEAQIHPQVTMSGTAMYPDHSELYVDENRDFVFGAAYAVAEGSPRNWIHFSAGARLNWYSSFGAVVVPRAAIIVRPAPNQVLKIMGGRSFRAPSIYEQYYNDGGAVQALAEDPSRNLSLAPESSYSGEIEYSYRFNSKWSALGAVHSTKLDNIIELGSDSPGSDVVRYANGSTATLVVGGDVEVRREWAGGTMFGAMYGFQHAGRLGSTQSNPILESVPSHLGSIRFVTPLLPDIASIGVRASLESPRRINAESDATTNAAVVVDATLSGTVLDTGLRYVVGLYNIGDWQYSAPVDSTFASATMPQNGRRFLLDLQWSLR